MILVIRISGMVDVPEKMKNTLFRMRLRRKYSAVLLDSSERNLKILKKIRNYVAYGNINDIMLKKLIEKRAESLNKAKVNSEKIISELNKKNLEDQGIKPFFRLHPPRGGIDSKKHFGVNKGVLGNNKDSINKLLGKML